MTLQPVVPFGRVFPDYPVDRAGHYRPPTADEQRAAITAYFGQGVTPVLYECGGCCAFHPADFGGDCREDLLRIDNPWKLLGDDSGDAPAWIECFPFEETDE
jgi:hypothetical protein